MKLHQETKVINPENKSNVLKQVYIYIFHKFHTKLKINADVRICNVVFTISWWYTFCIFLVDQVGLQSMDNKSEEIGDP